MLLARTRALFPGSVYISTRTGEGMEDLMRHLEKLTGARRKVLRVLLPPSAAKLVAMAHARGSVYEESYRDDGSAELLFQADDSLFAEYEPFLIENGGL